MYHKLVYTASQKLSNLAAASLQLPPLFSLFFFACSSHDFCSKMSFKILMFQQHVYFYRHDDCLTNSLCFIALLISWVFLFQYVLMLIYSGYTITVYFKSFFKLYIISYNLVAIIYFILCMQRMCSTILYRTKNKAIRKCVIGNLLSDGNCWLISGGKHLIENCYCGGKI